MALASVAERSIATDCKSVALRATKVRILPGAPMSNKYSRAGKKFTGNHTTLIPAASLIADIAHACPTVTKISPGFIKAGLKSVQGKRRLKITDKGTHLLLSIRDNTSHQEIHVYTSDQKTAERAIADGALRKGVLVSSTARP